MALKPHHQAERRTELGWERFLKELRRERFLQELEQQWEWKRAVVQQWDLYMTEQELEWKREREREERKRVRELEELELEEKEWKRERAWKREREREREREERDLEWEREREQREQARQLKWKREQDRKEEWERQLEDLRSKCTLDQEGARDLMELERDLGILEREGRQTFLSGSKYNVFMPRALDIAWGNDARYWRLPEGDDEAPAELVKVSWLEVSSELRNIEIGKKYEISFRVSFRPNAFGWSDCPIYLMAKIGKKGKYMWEKIQLDAIQSILTNYPPARFLTEDPAIQLNDHATDQLRRIPSFPVKIPQEKFEIEVTRALDDDDKILYFGLYEVWTGVAKGGLLIHNAIVKKVN